VDLLEDGKVVGEPLLDSWDARLGGPKNEQVRLFLYCRGDLFSIMLLHKKGYWVGGERGGAGQHALRPPEEEMLRWQLLADPRKFQAEQTQNTKFAVKESLPPQLDWERYAYNLGDAVDRGSIPHSNTAIGLVACDRSAYFQRVVQSLVRNPETKNLPIFCFIDKPTNDQKMVEVEKQAELCRKMFPQSVIIRHPRNLGCGRNIIDARIQLFSNMKYDYVFLFEDDMVVSPHYIAMTTRLMKWAEDTYDNVGAVQGWNINYLPLEQKQSILNEVHVTYTNWWGYLMSKRAWDDIFPDVLEYQELFLGGSYSGRPHRSIVEWFHLKFNQTKSPDRVKKFPADSTAAQRGASYFRAPPTGQDALTMVTLEANNWVRLATTVNRGEYIGRQGIHMNPRRFVQDGFERMTHDIFEEDEKMQIFQPKPLNEVVVEKSITTEIPGIQTVEA
jgi:hypothetical protein